MKKRILILLGILIIGGGAAAGVCWKMGVFGQQETSGDSVYVTKISDLTGQTSGVSNRYAGVVEPQETVSVELESGRTVKEVQVKTGDQVKKGQLLFGTVETWLIWKLTKGRVHVTDYSNASRTMLFNINTLQWDQEILNELDIPKSMLPKPMPSSCIYGKADPAVLGGAIPIAGAAGDQQAALFGQTCFNAGEAKNTYGTGCFLLMNTGEKPVFSKNGLVTTIAWGLDGKVTYALEGSIFVAGAAIQWLRDEVKIVDAAPDSEFFCNKVPDTNGCYVVPAFTGLGAPHWNTGARGMIIGITAATSKEQITRAALESMAYQTRDLLEEMERNSGIKLKELKVDGGASKNDFLMQFQADILNCRVVRPKDIETTALGACYLAGLGCGIFKSEDEIKELWEADRVFEPQMDEETRENLYAQWCKAVEKSKDWL